jgi:hypothetical protein
MVDTNILVYAAKEGPEQAPAVKILKDLGEGHAAWCLTWPIIYEFLRVVTHPKVLTHPLSSEQALQFVEALFAAPNLIVLGPGEGHLAALKDTLSEMGRIGSNLMHDFATAVVMRENGIDEIITADGDFRHFPFLRIVNPLH